MDVKHILSLLPMDRIDSACISQDSILINFDKVEMSEIPDSSEYNICANCGKTEFEPDVLLDSKGNASVICKDCAEKEKDSDKGWIQCTECNKTRPSEMFKESNGITGPSISDGVCKDCRNAKPDEYGEAGR